MWSTVENNLGISIACIPLLAPLIKSFAEKSSNRSAGPTNRYGASGGGTGSGYALHTIGGGRSVKGGFVEIGKGRVVTGSVQTRSRLGDMESSSEELTSSRDIGKEMGIHRTMEIMVSHDSRDEMEDFGPKRQSKT